MNSANGSRNFPLKEVPVAIFILFLFTFPLISLFYFGLQSEPQLILETFKSNGVATFLRTFFYGTLIALISNSVGFFLSIIFSYFDFPLRKILLGCFPLFLAFPVFVISFAYLNLYQDIFGFQKPLSLYFLGFVLASFPYSFLLFNSVLGYIPREQSEYVRLQNWSPWKAFKHLDLPRLKPVLWGSFFLIMFEFFSDIGASHLFGVKTVGTLTYELWSSYFSLGSAAFVCLFFLSFIVGFLWLQSRLVKRIEFGELIERPRKKIGGWISFIVGSLFLSFFLIPLAWLVRSSIPVFLELQLIEELANSMVVTFLWAFGFALSLSLIFIWLAFQFRRGSFFEKVVKYLADYGYATPGVFLAIGIGIPFFLSKRFLEATTLWVGLSGLAILIGWTIKFFKVGFEPLRQFRNSFDLSLEEYSFHQVRSLKQRWGHILFPLVKSSFGMSFFFLVIEAMKELPLVLLLRPPGFENVAVSFFEYASESDFPRASLFGLSLVIIGLFGQLVYFWLRRKPC